VESPQESQLFPRAAVKLATLADADSAPDNAEQLSGENFRAASTKRKDYVVGAAWRKKLIRGVPKFSFARESPDLNSPHSKLKMCRLNQFSNLKDD